jgi:hypothetical protein
VSYQVNWEVQALDRTVGFLRDDTAGVAGLWESVSRLADEPQSADECHIVRGHDLLGHTRRVPEATSRPAPDTLCGPWD